MALLNEPKRSLAKQQEEDQKKNGKRNITEEIIQNIGRNREK